MASRLNYLIKECIGEVDTRTEQYSIGMEFIWRQDIEEAKMEQWFLRDYQSVCCVAQYQEWVRTHLVVKETHNTVYLEMIAFAVTFKLLRSPITILLGNS